MISWFVEMIVLRPDWRPDALGSLSETEQSNNVDLCPPADYVNRKRMNSLSLLSDISLSD